MIKNKWRKKGGRPRKMDAKRYKNGRLVQKNDPVATPELMAKRIELVGVALAMSETPGRASALLRHWGIIDERQAEALEKYRQTVIDYRRRRLIPKSAARTSFIETTPEPVDETADTFHVAPDLDDEAAARRAKARMDDLWGEINKVEFPILAREMLEMFAIEDIAPPAWRERNVAKAALSTLLHALDLVADYFGLAKD